MKYFFVMIGLMVGLIFGYETGFNNATEMCEKFREITKLRYEAYLNIEKTTTEYYKDKYDYYLHKYFELKNECTN